MKLKTKKIIVVTVSVIIILLSLFSAYMFRTGQIESEQIQIEGIEIPQITNQVQTVLLCILAGINFVILLLSKNLVKHKIVIIVLYAVQALIGGIPHIIAAIIGIPILCVKTQDVQEEKKKLELPVLEEVNKSPKWLYIIVWLAIFVIAYTPLINSFTTEAKPFVALALIISIYIIQIVVPAVLMGKNIKRDFKAFIKNFKTYFSYMLPKFGIFLVVYFIVAIALLFVVGEISTNQQTLNEMPLWITAILAIGIAPFIEELMFRGLLKQILGNNKLYLFTSSLVFGALHVMYVEQNILNYLYIIPYAMLGYLLAKVYAKTDNIFTNIFLHAMWNTLAVVLMVFSQFIA
ncbi:MAG: CPBP family intramembrane metalloprotease [Clostridia bacterium]|jgi:membrane protease YdiL (CAAX protease family)|nr:CPBP family intramembrane metalloprotease [Clostridia bacterium]